MKLLFVGNFNIARGTGYSTILKHICHELTDMGHTITILGTFWDRSEHYFPFQIIPTDYSWIPVHVMRLHQALKFDHVVLAMDVPKIDQILNQVEGQELAWPVTSGLFPIESHPLVKVWADGLSKLHRRLVISKFGKRILGENGLDSTFIPMTAEMPEQMSVSDAREMLKEHVAVGDPDLLDISLVVLTVADNMERKDLPVIGQALVHLREKENVNMVWALVTSINSPYGWWLPGMLEQIDMTDQTLLFEELSLEAMNAAYWACDVFAIASQAEGACLPLYEAMARDKLCIAPDHTAITEALMNGRGMLVPSNGRSLHPWGNVYRYHLKPEQLAKTLAGAHYSHADDSKRTEFIKSRPWSLAAERIQEALTP